jgi:hypothetical protein
MPRRIFRNSQIHWDADMLFLLSFPCEAKPKQTPQIFILFYLLTQHL